MQQSEVVITFAIIALFTVIYCFLLVASARARMRHPHAHMALQQVNPNEPPPQMTICNVCQKWKLCSWVRVGIGNVWMCAWCARAR